MSFQGGTTTRVCSLSCELIFAQARRSPWRGRAEGHGAGWAVGAQGQHRGAQAAQTGTECPTEAVPALQCAHTSSPLPPRCRTTRRLLRLIGVKFNLQQSAGGEAGAELARRGALASAQAPSPAGRRSPGCPPAQSSPPGVTQRWGLGAAPDPRRVSYGVAGCTHILIRKNNNLSKIHMICVFFPDRIYIGIIHQLGLALAKRETEEKKKLNKGVKAEKPLGSECCLPAGSPCSEPWLAGTPRLLLGNLECSHRDGGP